MKQAHHIRRLKAAAGVQLAISSRGFASGENIPAEYACMGKNINPPLEIDGIPEGTKSMAITMEDQDRSARHWVHWVAWNIPPVKHIKEGRVMEMQGVNDWGRNRYDGPYPPWGIHHYSFKVYALNELLNLPAHTTKSELESAMKWHILGSGELIGLYKTPEV